MSLIQSLPRFEAVIGAPVAVFLNGYFESDGEMSHEEYPDRKEENPHHDVNPKQVCLTFEIRYRRVAEI